MYNWFYFSLKELRRSFFLLITIWLYISFLNRFRVNASVIVTRADHLFRHNYIRSLLNIILRPILMVRGRGSNPRPTGIILPVIPTPIEPHIRFTLSSFSPSSSLMLGTLPYRDCIIHPSAKPFFKFKLTLPKSNSITAVLTRVILNV